MGLSETFRRSFIAGVALVAPLVITVFAFRLIFGWLRQLLDPIIQRTGLIELAGNIEIAAEVGAILLLFVSVAGLGYIAQRSLGAWTFGLLDRLIGRIPMVRVIYTSIRQVSDALMQRNSRYESVVLVEYPRTGLYSIGFVTAESPQSVTDALGTEAYNIYLPYSPNPTQGHFTLVPTDQVTDLDMSVSQAIRLLVTTGIAEDKQELEAFREDLAKASGESPLEDGG